MCIKCLKDREKNQNIQILHLKMKKKLQERCRKFGIQYEEPAENESYQKYKLRRSKLQKQTKCKIEKYKQNESDIPSPPPLSNNAK